MDLFDCINCCTGDWGFACSALRRKTGARYDAGQFEAASFSGEKITPRRKESGAAFCDAAVI
jgi:hypothetical protein